MADNEIDEKIKEAARILREDHVHVSLKELRERFDKHFPDEVTEPPEPPSDPNAPPPPPKKDEPAKPSGEGTKKSGWWPEGSLDDS